MNSGSTMRFNDMGSTDCTDAHRERCRRCGQRAYIWARGLCKSCYQWAYKHHCIDRYPRSQKRYYSRQMYERDKDARSIDWSRKPPVDLCATCVVPRGRANFDHRRCAAEGCMMQSPLRVRPHGAHSRKYSTAKQNRNDLAKYWRPAKMPAGLSRF